jgi:small subunit ribosomal protein S1
VEIVVDLGNAQGVIQSREIERMDKETLDALKVGEQVLVYVVSTDAKTGQVVLSLQRAQEERDWREAERLQQTGEVFAGKVDGYNKGGLIVRFGRVRGFVPESQVSRDRRRRTEGAADPNNKWATMRGEDVSVKVLEVDRARNRLILSEREAAPQMREAQKVRLLDELQVGDVKVGRVKSVADFGVFVDVGGADGLVHLTELSWKHIAKPTDVFKVGQEVKVEVISVDRDRKRIGLSIKRQEEDPWTAITKQYGIGQLVQGQITKLTKFGAFARLVDAPEIEGLIHISELADHRVNHPRDVVNEGDVLTLRVVKIDQVERRMGLSLKRVDSPEYIEADYRRATRPPGEVMNDIADFEAAAFNEERKRDRKKGGGKKGGKKGTSGSGGRSEFEEEDDY